jgi:hypothetical protein
LAHGLHEQFVLASLTAETAAVMPSARTLSEASSTIF